MPRGGARPGAGRKPKNPEAHAAKKQAEAAQAHAPAGKKLPGTPASWPFGTEEPAAVQPAPVPNAAAPDLSELTPLEYLLSVVRDAKYDERTRIQAASIAAPFVHAKPAPVGKKEGRDAAAKTVASRFSTGAPPKLVAAGGKKV
jgi:hypothetical protein